MPARMPTTAPTRAPIPAAPAAQPTRTPRPMQRRSAASRTPPAPAGSNEDGEAACISRASVPKETGELVTGGLRQMMRFPAQFVRLFGRMPRMARPRLLLVHGSVVNGEATWGAQRPLAERFELVVPNRRGFPPGPDVERVDFEDEAVWLEQFVEPGTHLVGHSYGGVASLYAAARYADRIRSLTVI